MNQLSNTKPSVIDLTHIIHILKAHRVWFITAAILLTLLTLNTPQGIASTVFTAKALISTAPFLLLSIGIAAYAGASGADGLIGKAFVGSPISMIVLAAVFGGLSPFCSCGVIPLIAALLSMGVPLAAVMAFWLASPVIDPSMFVLTSGLLGLEFAIAKTFAAIGLGLLGGFTTLTLVRNGFLSDPLRPNIKSRSCGASSNIEANEVVWKFWHDVERRKKFVNDALSTTLFLLKWLSLAFVLESLMVAYMPAELVASALGGSGIKPIATATLVGVPAYMNGYAALPLVSGLIDQGMAPGAGLAFLVAGGITSLPAAIAVFALVKRQVFALYIGFALSGSMLSGLLFQAWLS